MTICKRLLRPGLPGICRSQSIQVQTCQSRQLTTPQQAEREAKKAAIAEKVEKSLHDDEHGRTVKLKPEARTISTAVGDLPLSPIMDPAWVESRQRYRTAKPRTKPGPGLGRFRKKLFLNPYAHALATPWRLCPATETGLPRYFLEKFELVTHPETGDPWWAPSEMADDIPENDPEEGQLASDQNKPQQGDTRLESVTTISEAEEPLKGAKSTPQPPRRTTLPPRGYLLSRHDILRLIGGPRSESYLAGRYIGLVARRTVLQRSPLVQKMIWREDMHLIVLESLRRYITRSLLSFASRCREKGYQHLTPCVGWSDINKDMPHKGCVLWLGHVPGSNADADADAEASSSGPGPWATLDVKDAKYERKLAVHNLPYLLGEECVTRLKQEPLFRDSSLLVLGRRRSMWLQMCLWKLQGYLAGGLK